MTLKKVIIIGGGFGGLSAAKVIDDSLSDVTVIDKTNHHLFQPLLYQVATAALSPADIAIPIRSILNNKRNTKVILDEAIDIDKSKKIVKLKNSELAYDYLIVAPGSRHSYFGKNEWEKYAPGLKTLTDAVTIREKIINSLELAEKENDQLNKIKYLTFVIVGGGPTGVELAGAIAEIAKKTIIKDYKNFKPDDAKIILIEAFPRVLNTFEEKISERAEKYLSAMGVQIIKNTKVEDVNSSGVQTTNGFIITSNVIWAAGNQASPLIQKLNIPTDRAGRIFVNDDCSIPDYPEIFVIGDASQLKDDHGKILPGTAPVAMQQGRFVAKIINAELAGKPRTKFKYIDKGNLATIGKAKAVGEIKGFKIYGLIAWLMWSSIHIFYLIGFKNRFRVMIEWIWYYITNKRGTRLIVGK
ncbi:MAG TPA: FAD-dependent oxidoreductase [Ignavibacteriales bacterium]|nr:FAD-dependent oxidoreductase [Ignavibacteriales bacterium]